LSTKIFPALGARRGNPGQQRAAGNAGGAGAARSGRHCAGDFEPGFHLWAAAPERSTPGGFSGARRPGLGKHPPGSARSPRPPAPALLGPLLAAARCAARASLLGFLPPRPPAPPARLPQITWVYLAVAVIAVDLSLAAQRVVWFGPIEFFRPVPPLVAELRRA